MALKPGSTLGHYEIVSTLGAGGMGEVYRARDTRLGREVAIKLLLDVVAGEPERIARFDREARVLASLNHSNIATLHGFETEGERSFLVMELVEGETLAERIARGPIPLADAIPLFLEVAEGLEAAHDQGVVHRDLKPANIKMTANGGVKILDFGLAKAMATDAKAPGDASVSMSPTLTLAATQRGEVLGTAAYMSPEQAKGLPVDRRTDVWAFGVCLYEALSGRRPFQADDAPTTMARVLDRDPEFDRLPADLPWRIEDILRRCLEKDPRSRLHDIADVRIQIEALERDPERLTPPGGVREAQARGPRVHLASLFVAAIAAAAVASVATRWWSIATAPETPTVYSAIRLPPDTEYTRELANQGANLAISPDGTKVVFAAAAEGKSQLYLRRLTEPEGEPIVGTENALSPFFSPDGEWIAFYADEKLKKVPMGGGAAVDLCAAAFGWGGTWAEDGTIVFSRGLLDGLWRVPENGGVPEPFSSLAEGENSHRWPFVANGSREVIFAVDRQNSFSWDDASIVVQSLDSQDREVLLVGGTRPQYVAATEHLLFARNGALLAVPLASGSRRIVGSPRSVLEGVITTNLGGDAHYAVAGNGTLVYAPGGAEDVSRSLVWVDRQGRAETLPIEPRGFELPRISPDGSRVALTIREGDSDVWVVELGRGTVTRVTSEPGEDHSVVWTPDGSQVAFSSTRGSDSHVQLKIPDGAAAHELLYLAQDEHHHLGGWTPDGSTLISDGTAEGSADLYVATRGETGAPRKYMETPFTEQNPRLSPNGRWVAYVSDESGRQEVYTQSFPEPGARLQISTDGGNEPMWAKNGEELFYRRGDRLMGVTVGTGSNLDPGTPEVVFERRFARVIWGDANYDIDPSGERFLILAQDEPAADSLTELILVLNWFDELERAAPTN